MLERRSQRGAVGRSLPTAIELMHHLADLQRVSQGPDFGARTKLPIIRRVYAAMRQYCNAADVMSVLSVYSLLGGREINTYCFKDLKAFVVFEVGALAEQAFSVNQELLFRFLALFDD